MLRIGMNRLTAALLCCLAMTQQPASAAQPWPTNTDPTAATKTFLLWEGGAPGAQGDVVRDRERGQFA